MRKHELLEKVEGENFKKCGDLTFSENKFGKFDSLNI